LIVADMSTIDAIESKNIANKFQENHIQKLEIPVMGGPNVAITGKLVMMASGPKTSFDYCKTIFEKIANKIFFLGEQGIANSIKLAMNLQITMLALSLSEGITLVEKSNVDPKIFLEVLNSTYFKTGMSENKAFKMIEGDYNPTFTLENLKKDIATIINTSKELGIELPMISKAEEIYKNAINEGLGNLDYTGIIEYIKKINNPKN
jgi:3-hydroxyisobutyrate dehydrogenase